MRHVDTSGECWIWTAQKVGKGRRYGAFRVGSRQTDPRIYAHRVSHELFIGPIPEGHQVDHVKKRGCTSTLCVRPDHLEAVPQHVNYERERLAFCKSGKHDLSIPESVRWDGQGRRRGCKRCWLDRANERRAARKGD